MPILLPIIAALFPRAGILLIALLTYWFESAFEGPLWPVLGFFFAPYTLLWYTAVTVGFGGTWGLGASLVMALAVMADLGGFHTVRVYRTRRGTVIES